MAVLEDNDYVVIGGGFYGCCLALLLRSVSPKVLLIEAETELLTRASRVNQARVHTGFHYPRSVLTAAKSLMLRHRFARDFPEAVVNDFQMLYAIARYNSKVSANRFYRMFTEMKAPIARAAATRSALFDSSLVEDVFMCTEWAFDYTKLRSRLRDQLALAGVTVVLDTDVERIDDGEVGVRVHTRQGASFTARYAFNVTYSNLNAVLDASHLPQARLKHELTEIALVRPPGALDGVGVTLMDGAFFSTMPYPAQAVYSLTHVRYTPHASWTDPVPPAAISAALRTGSIETRVRYMVQDGARYLPCLREAEWITSLFEIKSVLVKNEVDDGRPILIHRQPPASRVVSILGGKLDNVYDMFDAVRSIAPEFAVANDAFLAPGASVAGSAS